MVVKARKRPAAISVAHTEGPHIVPKPATDSSACKLLKVSRSTQIHRFNRRVQTLPVKFVNQAACSNSAVKSTHDTDVQTSAKSITVSFATSNIPTVSDCALPAVNRSVQTSHVLSHEPSLCDTSSALINGDPLISEGNCMTAVQTLSATTQSSISTIDTAHDVTNSSILASKEYIPPSSEPILGFAHQIGPGFKHELTQVRLVNSRTTEKHLIDSACPVYKSAFVDTAEEGRKYSFAKSLDSEDPVLSSGWSSRTSASSSFAAAGSDNPSGDMTVSSDCPPLCFAPASCLRKHACPHISRPTQTSTTALINMKHFPIIISCEPLDRTNGHSDFPPGLQSTAVSQASRTESMVSSGHVKRLPLQSPYTKDTHLIPTFVEELQTSIISYTQSLGTTKTTLKSSASFVSHSAQTELYGLKPGNRLLNFVIPEEQKHILRSDPKMCPPPLAVNPLEGQMQALTRRPKLSNRRRIIPNKLHTSYSVDVRFVSRGCQTEPYSVNSSSLMFARNLKSEMPYTSYSQYTSQMYGELSQKHTSLRNCGGFRIGHNMASVGKLSVGAADKARCDGQVGHITDSFTLIPRPPAVICYICGREYGTASISIHEKQCLELLRQENSKLPAHLQRIEPVKPQVNIETARYIRGTKTGSYDLSVVNGAAFAALQVQYVPCEICGRTFLPESLQVHARSCRGFSRRK